MTTYRICIVAPPGYSHAACFSETALLLRESLRSMGYDCDLALNALARDRINIILGINLLSPETCFADHRVILYQLEQLSETEGWYTGHMGRMLSRANAVWDYSLDNVKFLRGKGIRAIHVPLGYHPALETIQDAPKKNIDVLFVGSLNDRRTAILSSLRDRGYVVKALFGFYGHRRDKVIAESRLLINIHYYDANLFEAVRVSYLLNNGVFIISENSRSYPWEGVPIPMVSYADLVDATEYWLNNAKAREDIRREISLVYRERYPMTKNIENALRSF